MKKIAGPRRMSMPCIEGRYHRWPDDPGTWRLPECTKCGMSQGDQRWTCTEWTCDSYATSYIRRRPDRESFRVWGAEWSTTEQRIDSGTCNSCMEVHRRIDQARERDMEAEHAEWLRRCAIDDRKREREARRVEEYQTWHKQREARNQTLRQRRLLREGHRTLTAIRRRLRGVDRSPWQESVPAKTSQTS